MRITLNRRRNTSRTPACYSMQYTIKFHLISRFPHRRRRRRRRMPPTIKEKEVTWMMGVNGKTLCPLTPPLENS